jgi:hypothetical protein
MELYELPKDMPMANLWGGPSSSLIVAGGALSRRIVRDEKRDMRIQTL